MIALIRQLILCVTAASLFGAVTLSLVPDRAIKEVIRLGIGLLLLLSVILPFRQCLTWKMPQIPEQHRAEPEETHIEDIILQQTERQTEQYIVELIQEYGLSGTADVQMHVTEDGVVSVAVVSITMADDISKQTEYTLRRRIVQELGAEEIVISVQ